MTHMSLLDTLPWFRSAENAKKRARALARQDYNLVLELARVRRERGLSQEQVAELLGVTQQAISKLERPGSDPRLSKVRQYAHAVGALVGHHVAMDDGAIETGEWICFGFVQRPDTKTAATRYLSPVANAGRFDFGLAA